MCKKCEAGFNEMAMFTFRNTILLGRVRTRHTVRDTRVLKVPMELMVFTTPIGLNCLDFIIQKAFDMSLEVIEDLFNVRLMFDKIYPAKMGIIINETNIVFKTSRGGNGRTPNIGVN
jgi:hypothetical protein